METRTKARHYMPREATARAGNSREKPCGLQMARPKGRVPEFTGVHIAIPHVPDVGLGSLGFSVPIAVF